MKRADGYYIKGINPYQKLAPHIMTQRTDALNLSKVSVRCEHIDRFIKAQSLEGNIFSYTDIIIASLIRLFAKRPALNRFVMNSKIFQHYDITLCFVVKKLMQDDSEDTTIKLHFDGSESLFEIKQIVDQAIAANTGKGAVNGVDKTAKVLTSMPHWLISFCVKVISFMDRHNMLPKSLIEVSPFHNSVFVTLLKSIKGDYIYHHCYNFGTTGIFVSVGKETLTPVVECGEVTVGRVMDIGIVADERFCDGLYYVNSMRIWKNILSMPETLLDKYDLSLTDNIVHGIVPSPNNPKSPKQSNS